MSGKLSQETNLHPGDKPVYQNKGGLTIWNRIPLRDNLELKEIEEDFISEHFGHFSPYINSRHDLPILSKLFLSMIENRELCLVLMGPNGAPQFTERIKHMMWPTLLEDWRRDFPQYSLEDLEFAYEFIFPGATNLILQWLRTQRV